MAPRRLTNQVRIRLDFVIKYAEPFDSLPKDTELLGDIIVAGLENSGVKAESLMGGAKMRATLHYPKKERAV